MKEEQSNESKKMGLSAAVALVFAGMVGSGILFLAHDMNHCGTWGVFSWILGAIMTYCMFLSFANVNDTFLRNNPGIKSPDMLDFLQMRFCATSSFIICLGHFAALTFCASVMALTLGNYFIGLVPGFILCNKSIAALSLLLMFGINVVSFSYANALNGGLNIIKLLFFLGISIFGAMYAPSYTPNFGSISLLFSGAGITMFAFMGIEYGIFAAGSIENPEENVIKATRYGLIAASVVFIGVYVACLFVLNGDLSSTTPVYDASLKLFGDVGAKLVGIVAIFSCLTGLNGNLVVQGNSLRNFSKKSFLPSIFDAETKEGFPWRGALLSLLISMLLILGSDKLDLSIVGVTFIGVLYLAVVLVDCLVNGINLVSLLALISCAIMLCNSFKINILAIAAVFYLMGYGLKFWNDSLKQEVK